MKKTPSKWLKEHLPTFCWQTFNEVVTFLEQIDPDVDYFSVQISLWRLVQMGVIERRMKPKGNHVRDWRRANEYRRR